MNITGRFKSIDDNHYYDIVITTPEEGRDIVIGSDANSDVFFDEDPVTITTNCEDLFTHIITTQARISLCSKIWLGDYLFANNVISNTINISRDGISIFDGFVEHNTFSQPYAQEWNVLEINCIDHLGVLEYMKMSDLIDYDEIKENQEIHNIRYLLNLILANPGDIYYDGSKRVKDEYNNDSIRFDYYLSICDSIWLGDSEDDVWTQYDLLNEILRYLNLHIIQQPDVSAFNRPYAYYMFDWQYYKTSSGVAANYHTWYKLSDRTVAAASQQITRELVVLGKDDYAGTDTNLSVDMVYNKISVKESGEEFDVVISNPLDTNDLTTPYTQWNRYMTEFVTLGQGRQSKRLLRDMISPGTESDSYKTWSEDMGWFRHWYIRYMYNPLWKFNTYQFRTNDISSDYQEWTDIQDSSNIYKDQSAVPYSTTMYNTSDSLANARNAWSMIKAAWYKGYVLDSFNEQTVPYTGDPMFGVQMSLPLLYDGPWYNLFAPVRKNNCIGATMFNIWSTGKITPEDSSTPNKKENDHNWIAITVGNQYTSTIDDDMIESDRGVCEYVGQSASFIPPNDETYWLVFTGKIVLSPFVGKVWDYYKTKTNNGDGHGHLPDEHSNEMTTSAFKYGSDDGCEYCRVFYDGETPQTDLGPEYNSTTFVEHPTLNINGANIVPWINDEGMKKWEYKNNGVDGDNIQKVGVLACRLSIGDKYLSEGFDTQVINGVTYYFPNNQYTWTDDPTSIFTIGFDPKIGDYIVGQEYDLGTNISTFLNIDTTKGIAIPIKKEDQLSGELKFTIIGPNEIGWIDNNYRHGTFWRHSRRWTNEIMIFNQPMNCISDSTKCVDNIFIGDLQCKLYSDNSGNDFLYENDIIYMSDDTNKYVEDNELEFKLISGFTPEDIELFGIKNKPLMNTILNAKNEPNLALECRYNPADSEGPLTKPEKQYVNQYFNLYNRPMILFNSTLKYTDNLMYFRRYQIGYLNNKIFNPISMEINLKYQTNTITMRQYES